MYFSKVMVDSTLPLEQMADLIPRNFYEMHQKIWTLFAGDPDAERSFLFHHIEAAKPMSYYVLSLNKPQSNDGKWKIESKEYAPVVQAGQQYFFSLKANPVVKKKDSERGKSKKHDVIMNARKEWREKHNNKPPLGKDRQQMIFNSAYQWLQKRGESNGFQINESHLFVDAYSQHQFFKSPRKKEQIKGTETRFSTIDFSGVLIVTDPAQFRQCLFHGIGSAKGFGCGLLLIRPYQH